MEAQRAKSAGRKFGTPRFYSNFLRFWTDGLKFLAEVMLRKDARRSFDSKATKHSEIAFHGSNELSTSQKLMLSFPVKRKKNLQEPILYRGLTYTDQVWMFPHFVFHHYVLQAPLKIGNSAT